MNSFVVLCLFFASARGLYEDQIGDTDWYMDTEWVDLHQLSFYLLGINHTLVMCRGCHLTMFLEEDGKYCWVQTLEYWQQ